MPALGTRPSGSGRGDEAEPSGSAAAGRGEDGAELPPPGLRGEWSRRRLLGPLRKPRRGRGERRGMGLPGRRAGSLAGGRRGGPGWRGGQS